MTSTSPRSVETPTWSAKILSGPPLISPVRQFIYPRPVPGEEDALARGAMYVEVHPAAGGSFLATCALGYASGSVASGIYATPHPDELCIVAGGYAYLADTRSPEQCIHLELRPVAAVLNTEEAVVFAGFHTCVIRDSGEEPWETPRLSWEGITGLRAEDGTVHGLGWDLQSDKDIPFTIDIGARKASGGPFRL